MATFTAERPQFFEGQYLGADDLASIVEYLRTTGARQNLSHHSWGIVIGLNLVSQPISDTSVEYYVQPGVAIDGYGRIIVVNNPARIEADQFVSIGSGNVDVWIRYDETEFSATRPGFNVCSASDDYARISETFKIVVGNKSSILDRQSGVTVNDTLLVDAREALISVDPDAEVICDASVPHQQLPSDNSAIWLIPLGHVRWQALPPGFLPLADPALVEELESVAGTTTSDIVYEALQSSRSKRQLIGTVTENILAAEGVIRLRERTSQQELPLEIDPLCAKHNLQSLDLRVCDGKVKPKELIWLEGDTRVRGDLRLHDGRLEFKNELGNDYIQRQVAGHTVSPINPLLIQRKERNELDTTEGSDLQLMLGDMGATAESRNRFVIGSILFEGSDLCSMTATAEQGKIFIEDNGRVGIGTYSPETSLTAPLTIRGLEVALDVEEGEDPVSVMPLINLEGQGGDVEWQISLGPDFESLSFNQGSADNSQLFLQADGNIGIGTIEPQAKLDIAQVSVSGGGSGLGEDIWFRVGDGADSGRVWIEYGNQAAPLLVLSDNDDPPRIQFQQTGSTDPENDNAPAHSSWIGHAQDESSDLAIMGGQLGVGTEEPNAQLTVQANGGGARFYSGQSSGHFWLGFYTDGTPGSSRAGWLGYGNNGTTDFTIRNEKAGGDIILTPNRNVGIGTSNPTEKLDVRGNIRLGPNGDFHAVSAEERLHTVAGRITSSGGIGQGSGFAINPPHVANSGLYTIRFSPPFASAPVVVASPFDHLDNVVSVRSVSSDTCVIACYDVLGTSGPQDIGFTFIAVGER